MAKFKYGDWRDSNNPYYKSIPYLRFFMDTFSEMSQQHVFLKIIDLAEYMKEHFNKTLLEVSGLDILHYFKIVVDKKPIEKYSKRLYRAIISSYYNYISDYKKQLEDVNFKNPVPSTKIWDFSGTAKPLDIDKLSEQEITFELIEEILHHVYYRKHPYLFICLSLIIYTGARISEIVSIKLKNMNLQERWFITKVKSKKNHKRDGIYFIPQPFISELEHYIEMLKLEYPDAIYLFQNKTDHFIPRTIQNNLQKIKKELNISQKINPHRFRDFINTKRFEKGCPGPILKFLLNQTVQDVNINHYLKSYKNKIKLRNAYDKYNPFPKLIKPHPRL